MAKKKDRAEAVVVEELTGQEVEAPQEAAGAGADGKRRKNAEKQARFRKSMIEKGYREIKTWEKPPAPGMVKPWGNSPPLIKDTSIGVFLKDEKTREAIKAMMSALFHTLRGEGEGLSKKARDIYHDVETLMAPLGYKDE